MKELPPIKLSFKPLTLKIWKDFEELFGANGACAGCWCMYWKMKRKEYDEKRKNGRTKSAVKKIVKSGTIPGLVAYHKGTPVGWIAIEPRDAYPVLNNSRILQPVDDKPVWSITCLFVNKDYRRMGVSEYLIKSAAEYAKKKKAKIVEAYPVEPKTDKAAPPFIFTGVASAYINAGFKEVVRRSETRPVMRLEF